MAVDMKTKMLDVLGDVKARVADRFNMDFPMPQMIVIGRQSVGKSRLVETLAGETFNFISGTLGSRRPTVLEFRNKASMPTSQWYYRNRLTNIWEKHTVTEIEQWVGAAHEELGATVSNDPIYIKVESPDCCDMSIVDLPGFRDFASTPEQTHLKEAIDAMVTGFMADTRNYMIVVEQAGDAANMSTLAKARNIDPDFQRTMLVRNKLDKQYGDFGDASSVQNWVDGHGDLPDGLTRFAFTLPWWPNEEKDKCPIKFRDLKEAKNSEDTNTLRGLGLDAKRLGTIGFSNFEQHTDKLITRLFSKAIDPVLDKLRKLRDDSRDRSESLEAENRNTDPNAIQRTIEHCGFGMAAALTQMMTKPTGMKYEGVVTLGEELSEFREYHRALGSEHFGFMPTEDMPDLTTYVHFLEEMIGTAPFQLIGGPQYRRMMSELEYYLRFSEVGAEIKKRDVIQARGISMTSLTWRDVIVKLLNNEAHVPLERSVCYVAERIRRFFEKMKGPTVEFMLLDRKYKESGDLLKNNELIQHTIFSTWDTVCQRQMNRFLDMFRSLLTSAFASPWMFLKGASGQQSDDPGRIKGDTKARIPAEIQGRAGVESKLAEWLQNIPMDAHESDQAADEVQRLVKRTYFYIRSQICDELNLFAESFFKVPMLRYLDQEMRGIALSEEDMAFFIKRRQEIKTEMVECTEQQKEISACLEKLEDFKLEVEARGF